MGEDCHRVRNAAGMTEVDGRREDSWRERHRDTVVEEILVGREVRRLEGVDLVEPSMELCMAVEELKSEVPVVDEKPSSDEDDRLEFFPDDDHPPRQQSSQDRRPM
jgi:hypothetical protein